METPTPHEIRAWLEREIALGLEAVPRSVAVPVARPVSTTAEAGEPVASPPAARQPFERPSPFPPGVSPLSDLVEPEVRAADSLAALREVLGDCRRCKLCKGRTNVVFGVGNPNARLMFIGEGPGEDEDRKGEPFVGKAGGLLTDIITKGMGLQRSDVYIANVVKCRPPGNREPEPDEVQACRGYLEKQVALVRPRVLVALGRTAAHTLLGNESPIGQLRGRWFQVFGIPTMVTYHPAALLRNQALKRPTWEDMQQVRDRLRGG
jgi:uracil-DNA glycosylase family 4